MDFQILWILCCILVAISLPERNFTLAVLGGTVLMIMLLFFQWLEPDAATDWNARFDSAYQFLSDTWRSIGEFVIGVGTE